MLLFVGCVAHPQTPFVACADGDRAACETLIVELSRQQGALGALGETAPDWQRGQLFTAAEQLRRLDGARPKWPCMFPAPTCPETRSIAQMQDPASRSGAERSVRVRVTNQHGTVLPWALLHVQAPEGSREAGKSFRSFADATGSVRMPVDADGMASILVDKEEGWRRVRAEDGLVLHAPPRFNLPEVDETMFAGRWGPGGRTLLEGEHTVLGGVVLLKPTSRSDRQQIDVLVDPDTVANISSDHVSRAEGRAP